MTLNACWGCPFEDHLQTILGQVRMMLTLVKLLRQLNDITVLPVVCCSGADTIVGLGVLRRGSLRLQL